MEEREEKRKGGRRGGREDGREEDKKGGQEGEREEGCEIDLAGSLCQPWAELGLHLRVQILLLPCLGLGARAGILCQFYR